MDPAQLGGAYTLEMTILRVVPFHDFYRYAIGFDCSTAKVILVAGLEIGGRKKRSQLLTRLVQRGGLMIA